MILNAFYYDDTAEHGGCGNYWREGSAWLLITPLTEEDVKEKMQDFAEQERDGYCHGRFLQSLSEEGVLLAHHNGEPIDTDYLEGGLLESRVNLGTISKDDIFSEKTYKEILEERAEKQRKEREAKRLEAEKRRKEIEEKETEKAINRLKQLGYEVTKNESVGV